MGFFNKNLTKYARIGNHSNRFMTTMKVVTDKYNIIKIKKVFR